jgi:hypothetical protein
MKINYGKEAQWYNGSKAQEERNEREIGRKGEL